MSAAALHGSKWILRGFPPSSISRAGLTRQASSFTGIVQLRQVLELADRGAESPQETRLRLVLAQAGMPPSRTQIEVFDHGILVGRLDMGWPEWKVGVQYDGGQHWTDPRQRTLDIDQDARYRELGWRLTRVRADLDTAGGPDVLPDLKKVARYLDDLAI
ncbi:hypothetical protein [Mycobacterium sp. C31M]